MKQLLAEQILSNILVDTKTNFKSRLQRFLESILSWDNSKSTACKLAGKVFVGIWDDVPKDLKSKLRDILPANVEKSVAL